MSTVKEFTGIKGKLLYIQEHLKAPKSQYNSFGDYHYRSCEDIQEALKPLLAETKTVLLLNDEVLSCGERFYIKATAMLCDVESPDSISNAAYAREEDAKAKMSAAQITGSCSSYARKYALNGLFCIDDSKDPDTPEAGKPVAPVQPTGKQKKDTGPRKAYVQQRHIDEIRREIKRTGAQEAAVCYSYHIKSLDRMDMEQYRDAMNIFRGMPSQVPEGQQYEMNFNDTGRYEDEVPFR